MPESQYELCETLCHMLLHKRERESHLNWQESPAAYIALTYEQKRGIAQQLAQWLVYNGQSAMPLEVAYEQVARALQRIPGHTPDEAPLILKTLVERSGLLREPNPDVVDFLHNPFKELLAGDDLAVRGDAESVVQHLDDESWRRMALFGLASPRSQTFADALVTRVLAHIRRMGIPARPASTLKSPNAKRTKTQTGKNAHPTDSSTRFQPRLEFGAIHFCPYRPAGPFVPRRSNLLVFLQLVTLPMLQRMKLCEKKHCFLGELTLAWLKSAKSGLSSGKFYDKLKSTQKSFDTAITESSKTRCVFGNSLSKIYSEPV